MKNKEKKDLSDIRSYYDGTYYQLAEQNRAAFRHYTALVKKIGIQNGEKILDVACGVGEWLGVCEKEGADISGVDISEKAISVCKNALPKGTFHSVPAESLPFGDESFDVVTCLGAIEHFIHPEKALKEMVRVGKRDGRFLFLVPNADFLTRRLGLYSGTDQVDIKEEVRTLREWEHLFHQSGLVIKKRWKDLHVLSLPWIISGPWYAIPIRAAQALVLPLWPLKWQYQVYHLLTPDS